MKDLGELRNFVGIRFVRNGAIAFMDQEMYISTVLQRYRMTDCKSVSTPAVGTASMISNTQSVDTQLYQELVGSLLFLATRTRPGISAAVNIFCRQISYPQHSYMIAAKRVLRYLQGTREFRLSFYFSEAIAEAYSDSDSAGDQQDRKSTSGFVLRIAGSTLMWKT